jgi:hypothetical protein
MIKKNNLILTPVGRKLKVLVVPSDRTGVS